MWNRVDVQKHRYAHPLLWPWSYIWIFLAFYLLVLGVVYLFYLKEVNSPEEELYYKALDARKRELTTLKLSALEPFIWKEAFGCKTLIDTKKNPVEDCIVTEFSFFEKGEKLKTGVFFKGKGENEFRFLEETNPPCLICHKGNKDKLVAWVFHYKYSEPAQVATAIWTNREFFYANGVILLLFFIYLLARLIGTWSGETHLIAVAIRGPQSELEKLVDSVHWKEKKKNFIYLEVSNGYIMGYLPKRELYNLYKKYFTGNFSIPYLNLKVGMVKYHPHEISYEGLRLAHMIASKASPGSAIIQEVLTNNLPVEHSRKAIWKKKEGTELVFKVIELTTEVQGSEEELEVLTETSDHQEEGNDTENSDKKNKNKKRK